MINRSSALNTIEGDLPFASLHDSDVVIEPLLSEGAVSPRDDPNSKMCLNGFFGVELSKTMMQSIDEPRRIGAFVTVRHKHRRLNINQIKLEDSQKLTFPVDLR